MLSPGDPPASAPGTSRRRFLARAGLLLTGSLLPGSALPAMPFLSGPLRRPGRYARSDFAPFPDRTTTGTYGVSTFQLADPDLLARAVAGGVRLLYTSPDHGAGAGEKAVGDALVQAAGPVFVMTTLPVEAWDQGRRQVAFHRELRESLGRLKRGNVEALLIRNADAEQIQDPDFQAFAGDVLESGLVDSIGVTGQSGGLEGTLEASLMDPRITVVVFAAYLARFRKIPGLLRAAREAGKQLVATFPEEGALWLGEPGSEIEEVRRRHMPWSGAWDPAFTRRALRSAVEETPAGNALLSLRREIDLESVLSAP
jgi:aryl-alcohol dehydrogenase-like predicted oxidoreductase